MKKTLIALAVAASAAVSGSAMAADWVRNGTNGSVDLGGTLSVASNMTPWEVTLGDATTELNAPIKEGQTSVEFSLNKPTAVLGIRNASTAGFSGQASGSGITPNISYGNAVDLDHFNGSVTTIALDVTDGNDTSRKIGTMTADFMAVAVSGYQWDTGRWGQQMLTANNESHAFFGGVPKKSDGQVADIISKVEVAFNGLRDHYQVPSNTQWYGASPELLNVTTSKYWSFYGSAISNEKPIKLKLDAPAGGNADISWKASLPITVSYQ
ncbi:hypothetical protein KV860_004463 [Escherichia coli]|nr:hypothetical protein [Escherichia coli]